MDEWDQRRMDRQQRGAAEWVQTARPLPLLLPPITTRMAAIGDNALQLTQIARHNTRTLRHSDTPVVTQTLHVTACGATVSRPSKQKMTNNP